MEAYLGLDLGTSGCRCAAIGDQGRLLALTRAPLPESRRNAPEHSEQFAEDWWMAATSAIVEMVQQLPQAEFRSMAVDGTSGSLLLCDEDGHPAGPALMYDDARAGETLGIIAAAAPREAAVHSPNASLAKYLHLLGTDTRNWQLRPLHQADWLLGKLLGRFGDSDENNALKLGYDATERQWPEWLETLGIDRAQLPRVHPAGHPLGPIDPRMAKMLGLPGDLLLATGTTDSTAAALASGIHRPGEAVTTLGSTLVMKILCDRPLFAPEFGIYSHRVDDLWLAGGASNSGGAVLLEYFDTEELQTLSQSLRPERPTGLDYYPLSRPGERFPLNDPQLAPRLTPRPESDVRFLQGMLEGMARIETLGYRRLWECGAPPLRSVATSGGGATNEAWQEIRQQALGVPVRAAAQQEAAYGAALLARRACARESALS